MEKEYIINVLETIRDSIKDYNSQGKGAWAHYPKEVTIEKDGIKIIIPFTP